MRPVPTLSVGPIADVPKLPVQHKVAASRPSAAPAASSEPIRKQSKAAPESLGGSSPQRGSAQALQAPTAAAEAVGGATPQGGTAQAQQVPRKNARAGLRTANMGVEREPWRSGSKEVPAASAARRTQPAAPMKEGEQPVSPRGLQRAQLVEKYKTEAAARKQAHTKATIERTASVAALLQHAASLQAPSSRAHLITNAEKQDAAAASLSKDAGMKQPANSNVQNVPKAAPER